MLDDILARLAVLPPAERGKLEQDVLAAVRDRAWIPNPGPQTDAYFSEADELFYGGQAGGGKSDLLIGLSLTDHQNSIIFRRLNDDAKDLASRAREVAGDNHKYNGQDRLLKLGHRQVRFAGCQYEEDKERHKGRARDLYGFDEISDFTESQYLFITTWNRSTRPGQRCRVVCAGNPPTRAEGLWVVKRWGAWLDKTHPKPAKPGELRWYIRGADDEDVEVDGPGPHTVEWDRKPVYARSRTFIPAELADNPDLTQDPSYEAMLDSLPGAMKSAYRDGEFKAVLKDEDFQVIPTAWIIAAQERWKPDGYKDYAMTAMALDPAGGGRDSAEIARRHGGWYAELISAKGEETADGSRTAGTVVGHRRNNCPVVVDVGGGYGGAPMLRLSDNGIICQKFDGSKPSTARTKDGQLRFANKRAEAWWKFREELDPDQEGGSAIALPPDPELRADLAAPTYEVRAKGIILELKEDIRTRLGRSPGKGDAVVMCLSEGNAAVRRQLGSGNGNRPKVILGHANLKGRR